MELFGVGPRIQGFDSLSVKIDAGNSISSSESGPTVFDIISKAAQTVTTVTYSSSGSVKYFVFAGSGNITGSNNVAISGANSRTISCWVYFTSKTTQSIMCIGVNGAGTGWGIETSSTVFQLSKGNSGTTTSITYDTGQWYNIVYTGENLTANSLTIKLYINGNLEYTGTDTSINTTNSTLKLGTNNAGTLFFNGRISSASVYKKVLSESEIKKNYNSLKSKFGL
jgi:hypothetical protein